LQEVANQRDFKTELCNGKDESKNLEFSLQKAKKIVLKDGTCLLDFSQVTEVINATASELLQTVIGTGTCSSVRAVSMEQLRFSRCNNFLANLTSFG